MFVKIVTEFNILLICVCILRVRCWAVDDEGCRTPDRGVGECVLIKECPSMINFLTAAPRPLPSYMKNKLKEYICGSKGNDYKVCCSTNPIPIPLPLMKGPVGVDDQNYIAKHRNLHLLPKDCGYTGIPYKISHGKNATLGEYPWMVLLSYSTPQGPKFKCGGTVINNRYILTAAHCITDLQEPLLGVRVGEYDISTNIDCEVQADSSIKCASTPVQDLAIEKIIPHPNFNTFYNSEDGFNDIGLLRVATKIKMTDTVQPICLPTGDTRNANLTNIFIAGWGYTERDTKISKILQKVSIPVLERKKCQKVYKKIKISRKQMCADGKKKDSCMGDSGGPLQTQKYLYDDVRSIQYGIISFGGASCGNGSFPGIYTRVDSYMDWILDNIEP